MSGTVRIGILTHTYLFEPFYRSNSARNTDDARHKYCNPLSAVAELHHTQTLSRNEWQIRVETQLRMSCAGNAFMLQGSLRAFEGALE